MAAANLKTHLLDTLESDVEVAAFDGAEQIFLTPYLALACSLLYMMAADGELEAQESSQLQAVLGGDKAVLSYALRYVQSVPVEQFFTSASELLSIKDKWCILTNVCDALLADGRADRAELALFAQMAAAFDVRETQFEPYFKILALKNDKSVLGKYAGVRDERQPMTPHFALAIALLYMLTADGSIGTQEVGQLESVIGEFEGLQNVALKYVRSVKLKQFLDEASALLKPDQKIYILTNVCDSMFSDGEVAHLEDKLFLSMLTAFGFTEKTFARYAQVLEIKNFKPFDTSDFKNHVKHDRLTGGADEAGITFQHALTDVDVAMRNDVTDAANQGVWVDAARDSEMSQFITRTMDDNIQSVSDDFENQSNVVKVGLNATAGLNLQKLDDGAQANHRQRILGDDLRDNLQTLQSSAQAANRQAIDAIEDLTNRQTIDVATVAVNLQTLDVEVGGVNRATIPPEIRAQNIHDIVEDVHHRLDRFEVAHSQFLQIGRAQKFTDAFVLLEDDSLDVNRQLVNASFARMGIAFPDAAAEDGADASDRRLVTPAVEAPSVVQAAGGADATTPFSNEASSAKRARPQVTTNRPGLWREAGLWRGRGFVYVQLVVAALGAAFAAPIETRVILSRSMTGPLILMPVLTPEFIEQRNLFESEQSSVQVHAP